MARMALFDAFRPDRRSYFREADAQFDVTDEFIIDVIERAGGYFDREKRLVIPGEK